MIGGMPLKKTNEMPKNQTGNHATVPKLMRKGPKYPFAFYVALVLSMTVGAVPVLAAGDPLAVINNLSTFIFSLIRAIGLILSVTSRRTQSKEKHCCLCGNIMIWIP